eukprot:TRINITY_DN4898_c0_g1_i1.p2 TRINITY_DN4898_c0_g1~~TRINITY_DN4898_c0_g1_i1.p2  ORF type:complete len:156 (+),score=22.31 TRINITY_DN4898_c0_g1_i1:91-558(+)
MKDTRRRFWGGFSMECFKHWWEFLRLGIPGVFMCCSEWWGFEVVALLAGLLGTKELAANMIIQNTLSIFFMFPLGVSVSASTLVGNALGANDGQAANRVARVCLSVVVTLELVMIAFLLPLCKVWGRIYSNDEDVVRLVRRLRVKPLQEETSQHI